MDISKDIPLNLIFVDEIARPVDPVRVEAYAAMFKEHGMNQAILLEPVGEKYRLVFGRHRFEAAKLNDDLTIKATTKVYNSATAAQERVIDRTLENLGRAELNALERAEHLAALQEAISTLDPSAKHGGDRKSKAVKDQSPIFGLRSKIAEKTGFSRSAFFLSVAICKGLSEELRNKIHGTWLASHQAGLKLLSEQKPARQIEILDILFADNPKATSVADALIIAAGQRLIPASEKRFKATQGNLAAMSKTDRSAIFNTFEDEIREFAQMRGWI